jgi:hypothetical protein
MVTEPQGRAVHSSFVFDRYRIQIWVLTPKDMTDKFRNFLQAFHTNYEMTIQFM